MTANIMVSPPYRPFMLPKKFGVVFNGEVWCGLVDKDPLIPANQVQVYLVNEDGSRTPVPQPIDINSGGFLVYNGNPAKFVTDTNHSLLVRDSLKAQVWYEPNMANVDPETMWSSLFLPPSSLTTRNGVISIVDYVSVKTFGAVGDGVKNDTVSIQMAIDYGNANSIPVYFPPGRYKVSTLYYYEKSILIGASRFLSTIYAPDSAVSIKPKLFDQNANTNRFIMHDLGFYGGWLPTAKNQATDAIHIKGYDYDVRRILISNYGGVGCFATSNDPHGQAQAVEHIESYIEDVKVTKCYRGGIDFNSPSDSYMKDIIVIALGDDDQGWAWNAYAPDCFGIRTSGDAGATSIHDSHVYGYFAYGYKLDAGSCRLYDCIGEGALSAQVYIGQSGAKIKNGRYFNGFNADGTSWRQNNIGIVLAAGVSDCDIETDIAGCPQGGVGFLGASGGHNRIVTRIYSPKPTGATSDPVAFFGTPDGSDYVMNTYMGSASVKVPYGINPQLTANYREVFAQGSLVVNPPTILHGFNLFSITKQSTGVYRVAFTQPCESNRYSIQITPTTDIRIFAPDTLKQPNGFTIQCKDPYSAALLDSAAFDLVIHGARA
ncbi:MAG: phage tailspike protein [Plesiomonas shigelloides]